MIAKTIRAMTISILWVPRTIDVSQKSSKEAARLGNIIRTPTRVIAPNIAPPPNIHRAIAQRIISNEQKLKKGIHFGFLLSRFIKTIA